MRLVIRVITALALGAIAAAAAVGVTLLQPVRYESTSVLLIPGAGNKADNEAVVRSLEALITSPPVATDISDGAKTGLTAAQVISRMTVTRPPSSAVLEVSFLDTDRARSIALSQAAGPALVDRLTSVAQAAGAQVPAVSEYTIAPVNSTPTTAVVEPPRLRNGVIGFGIGLLLGAGLAAWRPRRQRRIATEAAAAAAFDTPLYATLPILGSGSWRAHSLDVAEDQLPIGWPPAARRLVVLSTGGRPSVRLVELLASAIAREGRDVLLVDAEPEERGLTATMGRTGVPGLSECLVGRADPVDASVGVDVDDLPREMSELIPPDAGRISLLPAGDLEIGPAALAGDRVAQVLRRVEGTATVIVHAPRLPGPLPANQFIGFADAVVVPVVSGRTLVDDAESVSSLLTSLTAAPVYVVLLTEGGGRLESSSRGSAEPRRLGVDQAALGAPVEAASTPS